MFGWLKRRSKPPDDFAEIVRTRPLIGAHGTEHPVRVERRPALDELVAVIPVAETVSTPAGRITLVSIERYSDGGIIRYFLLGTEEAQAAEAAFNREFESLTQDPEGLSRLMESRNERPMGYSFRLHLQLSDDINTNYVSVMGSGGGGANRWEAGATYYPAISESAKQLRISLMRTDKPVLIPGAANDAEHLHTFVINL
jgi:hypothetical protein